MFNGTDIYPVFDERVFAARTNVKLVVGRAVREHSDRTLLTEDRPWEVRIDNGYPNVVYRPREQPRYLLFYDCFIRCKDPRRGCNPQGNATATMYAESDDGITWRKPALGLTAFNGSSHNNIVTEGSHGVGISFEEAPVNGLRFKALGKLSHDLLMGTMQSDDGLHWTRHKRLEIGNRWDAHHNHFFDERTRQYVLVTRGPSDNRRPLNRTVAFATSAPDTFGGFSRAVVRFASPDLHDQLYSLQAVPYYSGYVGVLMVYDNRWTKARVAADGVRCELAYSLDLRHWVRLAGELLPRAPGIMNCFAAKPLVADDGRIVVYYMAGDGPHFGLRRTALQRASLRADGLVALQVNDTAASPQGITVTRPMHIGAGVSALAVTFDGRLRVGVSVVSDDATRGVLYRAEDCGHLSGSATNAVVHWRGAGDGSRALRGVRGRDVVLSFELLDADTRLYTFSFV